MKSLTVIIPCFNCEDTLPEAVESCFHQGLEDFEIIMVDDCSTDSTRALMSELAAQHQNIRLFYHEKNRGGGATRNTAARHASTDVIFCLDSDDVLPEGTLLKLFQYLKEKKCDGVGVEKSIKFVGKDTNAIETVDTFGYVGEKIPLESLLQKKGILCPLYSTFMITKDAFHMAGGYPENHGFDTQGFAWRFLAHGLLAFTCPGTSYLHRVQFKESYYLREASEGKINYNWRAIFFEHFALFNHEAQQLITSFDYSNFTKDLFEELKKSGAVFRGDYSSVIGPHFPKGKIPSDVPIFIRRKSFQGILLRLKAKLVRIIKKNSATRNGTLFIYGLFMRTRNRISERKEKDAYYKAIEKIKMEKRIVIEPSFGGIGDCLAYSSLPRLLKETYDVECFISRNTLHKIRHGDVYRLCFEMNPYVKGISDEKNVFTLKIFESEKGLYSFLTDFDGENILEALERQFGLKGNGRPEIYYEPRILSEYEKIILVDTHAITGEKLGWRYKENRFLNEALKHRKHGDKIEFADPKKQDLFTYVDMIFSCRHFIGPSSGGAAIAACFDKPFTVVLPSNVRNGSTYQFNFTKSRGRYVR